jgi:two-component sensor histidine kinase
MSDHAPMPAGDHSPRPPIMPFRRGSCRSASASESVGSSGGDGGDEMARLLVREADHRIANSLQLVVAQLTRGRLGVMDPAAADLLDRALAQVTAIAEVQRVLSCGAETGEVGLRRTLTAMAARLADLRPGAQVSVAAEDVPALQPRQLEVVAVITAELVMNALKHAFPVGRPGHVAVRCGVIAGDLVLTVSDDGLGRRSDVGGASASGGTGQEMMVRLMAMLGGMVRSLPAAGGGTMVRVSMPLRPSQGEPPRSAHPRPASFAARARPGTPTRFWRGRAGLRDLGSSLSGLLIGRR